MKYFLEHNNKKYTKDDLIKTLCEVGIKKGDIICVHTELFKFGFPLLPKNEFLQTILESFFEAIGKEGTLIMPTFTYSFCKNQIYDKLNSKCEVGLLNEYFRKQKDVIRSNDPIFSFALWGAKKYNFIKKHDSCFGTNSIFDLLVKYNAKLILFGTREGHTITHYVEEKIQVPYRYFKTFSGKMIDETSKDISINYYVRHLDRPSLPNVDNINKIAQSTKHYKEFDFAGSFVSSFNFRSYTRAIERSFYQWGGALILTEEEPT
ncbi:AAC(3) family N-acetyltransferase [Campylobacter insulaenigrae]|uniref:AAC(3) family N-acetyltransferase n=1 Tax=Campylobacter insulaenigrae TaxID=260714 RepID=UPI0021536E29|nr:AAC(3) family N-acetyltransferase [Campylobacter insulaenigrae]MCR6581829.1 AAC(3) family N-acetyltransferase [Campylobacter insulaenigrae]